MAEWDTKSMLFHREMDLVIEPVVESLGDGEERAQGAARDGLLAISISSEKPVLRYDWRTGEEYWEVLDHGPHGPDLSYARDGLPFLFDHSLRAQVGLIEHVRVEDRKLRGDVRFGSHPDAKWIEQDMRSGIRKKISVGYDPGRTYRQEAGKDGGLPTRYYTGWMPYEGSTVAVPADYDVGVARSAFEGSNARAGSGGLPETSRKAEERTMEEGKVQETPAAPAVGVGRDYEAERKQRNEALARLAKQFDATDLLPDALARDLDPAAFASAIGERNMQRAAAPTPAGKVDLSPKEQRQYSISRAIRAMLAEGTSRGVEDPRADIGIELEVSRTIADRMGRQPKGIFFPLHLGADRFAAAQARAAVTGNVAGTASLGGAGVATEVQALIELLRNEVVTIGLGARMLPGLTSSIQFPRQITANTWTWEGENPSTEKSLTAATFDSFTLSPKTGYGATAFSKQLVVQASYDVEQMVREDLAAIAALGIDSAAINGSGSSNQPTGVLNVSGVETEVMGTNGANIAWTNIVNYVTKQKQNSSHKGKLAFLSTPGVEGYLRKNLKNTVSGADYLLSESGTLNGHKAEFSNQVPSTLTKGTSTTICHGLVFGNWQECLIGVWGDVLDITINPYTYAKQGMVEVVATAMVDIGVRHPKSFVVTKDILV